MRRSCIARCGASARCPAVLRDGHARAPDELAHTHRVQPLTDLFTFGYPHAVTHDSGAARFEVVFRAYKGHGTESRERSL